MASNKKSLVERSRRLLSVEVQDFLLYTFSPDYKGGTILTVVLLCSKYVHSCLILLGVAAKGCKHRDPCAWFLDSLG